MQVLNPLCGFFPTFSKIFVSPSHKPLWKVLLLLVVVIDCVLPDQLQRKSLAKILAYLTFWTANRFKQDACSYFIIVPAILLLIEGVLQACPLKLWSPQMYWIKQGHSGSVFRYMNTIESLNTTGNISDSESETFPSELVVNQSILCQRLLCCWISRMWYICVPQDLYHCTCSRDQNVDTGPIGVVLFPTCHLSLVLNLCDLLYFLFWRWIYVLWLLRMKWNTMGK